MTDTLQAGGVSGNHAIWVIPALASAADAEIP
jgi:hypothetical protein